MKLTRSSSSGRRGQRGFTLVEALIASTTLVIIVGSVIMCNLFGLAMADRQQIWLGASDDSAEAVSTLTTAIRSANTLQIGSYSSGVFTQDSNTNAQSGNALLVYSTSNSYPWSLFYYEPTSNNLVQTNYYGPSVAGDYNLVSANPITNDSTHPIFSEVDYNGNPVTNASSFAISIYLSFTKLQDPQIIIENGSLVDLYTVTAVVFPRLRP